jgi:hypothetical protein
MLALGKHVRPYLKDDKNFKRARGMVQMVEHLCNNVNP